jgi:hypothetical protein
LTIFNIFKNLLLIYGFLGMTIGHRIEPKTFRMRKRPKKTASNARITREPFRDLSQRIIAIPTFIDDYNHYIKNIDQSSAQSLIYDSFSSKSKRILSRNILDYRYNCLQQL